MALQTPKLVPWFRQHQRTSHALIAFAWAALFLLLFLLPGPAQRFLQMMDYHFADRLAVHGRLTPQNPGIVFLGIDNASIQLDEIDPEVVKKDPILNQMVKGWPWSREVHAAILDKLAKAGAKVVIFDVLFTKPGPGDDMFKAALDLWADRVIIGCNFIHLGEAVDFPSESLVPQTLPVDPRVAYVNFYPYRFDNIIRKIWFQFPYQGPAIGKVASDVVLDSIAARTMKILGEGDKIPPMGPEYLFRFTGTPGQSFKTYSIYQLFYPSDWKGLFQNGAYFKDKIVMVGPKGNFQHDEHDTPFGTMDGAEIHLQALNAGLHGELLFYTGSSPLWLALLVAVAAFVAWLLGITMEHVTLRRVALCAFLAVTLSAIYIVTGMELYSHGIILAAAAPFGTLTCTMLTGLSGQYILEQIERARTRRVFERYVSPRIVREILDNPAGYYASLGGRRREVTILFSDLRGFTTMTELADSEQLVRELNEYFKGMTRVIFENNGILDKFIGDAVMAVWGSFQPHPQQDARNAVLAALAMHRELAALNVRRRERGLPDLAMGVGLNHGEAIVGDIGSEQQMNFTVIGDSVNLASRLEGTTKEYGVGLLISESVAELVRPFFHLQTVDSIVVKGRTKPVMTYTVHGPKEEALAPEMAAYLDKFEEAMRAYRGERFQEARDGFAKCGEIFPHDKLAGIFEARSAEFAARPPSQPWDGAYTMTKK